DHVLLDRQVREQLGLLVDDGDAVRAVVVRPRAAVDEDLALVARDLAGEDLHHRALARPVGSGDTEDLARCRVEVEAVQRDRVAVVLAHAAHRHTRGRRTHVRPCWRLVSRSITTAPTVTVPSRICDANGPAAMRATPLKSTARRSAPIIVPIALPLPPERLGPPLVTGAKTGERENGPSRGPPAPTHEKSSSRATQAMQAQITKAMKM